MKQKFTTSGQVVASILVSLSLINSAGVSFNLALPGSKLFQYSFQILKLFFNDLFQNLFIVSKTNFGSLKLTFNSTWIIEQLYFWHVWLEQRGCGVAKGDAWRGEESSGRISRAMEELVVASEGEMKYVDENCQDISEFKGERKKILDAKKKKPNTGESKTKRGVGKINVGLA